MKEIIKTKVIISLSLSQETGLVPISHYHLINSGELLTTLLDDWLKLRTDNLKFSGLANILHGTPPLVDLGSVLAVVCLSRTV